MSGRVKFAVCTILAAVCALIAPVSSWAVAPPPTLLFSDLVDGPKTGLGDGLGSGAIVTVWGYNLGALRGDSQIFCNGQQAAYVYYWGNADGSPAAGPSDLYSSHKMQTIAFSVAASAADGTGKIYVTVSGMNSNVLPFTVRGGSIYHVKATGSDSSSGSWSSPWLTMDKAGSTVPSGGIVYFGDGVRDTGEFTIKGRVGAPGKLTAFVAYPGATVKAQNVGNYMGANEYLVLSKLSTANDTGSAIGHFTKSRTVGNEATDVTCANTTTGALAGAARQSGSVYFGNYVHDVGGACSGNQTHTTYFTIRENITGIHSNEGVEFAWNYLKDNEARAGIHVYDEGWCGVFTGVSKIHDNVVVNQTGVGFDINTGCATGYFFDGDFEVYNNIFINCGRNNSGGNYHGPVIFLSGSANRAHVKFYNNLIYGFGGNSDVDNDTAVHVAGPASGKGFAGTWEWKNNIVVDTKNASYYSSENTHYDVALPAASSNNIWFNGGDSVPASPPRWDASPITTDPLFVDAAARDFRLSPGSPAIGAGSPQANAIVSRDFVGNVRARVPFDIGPLYYPEGRPLPPYVHE